MTIIRAIQSEIEAELQRADARRKVVVIYGPRQAGKTTLCKTVAEKFPGARFFNCDYPDVAEAFSVRNAARLAGVVAGAPLIVLDEAQRIPDVGLTLKILHDEFPSLRVVATGSSSFELSNQTQEPLTGRKREFFLYPIAWSEASSAGGSVAGRRAMERALRLGSYPAVLTETDEARAESLIREISGSYLFKDVFSFQDLRKPELLTRLLQLLAFQIGQEVSYQELARTAGVDQTVVQRYVHLLEAAFVVFRLPAFRRNLRSEVVKTRKVYFWDLGVRNAVIGAFQPLDLRSDVGALWENFCIAERRKALSNAGRTAPGYFWRDYQQQEVDYLEDENGKLRAWEIKWGQARGTKIPSRFAQAYPEASFDVVRPDGAAGFLSGK